MIDKHFTHNDFDGIGCAILSTISFGNVDVEYCANSEINSAVEAYLNEHPNATCYITDISVCDELAARIDANTAGWKLFDHHPTALHLNKYSWCKVEVNDANGVKTSGTMMYYNWLVDHGYLCRTTALDAFVEIVRDYDTWRWTDSASRYGVKCKYVNDLLDLYGRDDFIKWVSDQSIYNDHSRFPRFDDGDLAVLRMNQKLIDNYIAEKEQQMVRLVCFCMPCGVVFVDKYINDVGNTICKMHPEIDFIILVDAGRKTMSFRTVKDHIDLGKDVAMKFGGGGHPKAAGASFSEMTQAKMIAAILNNSEVK